MLYHSLSYYSELWHGTEPFNHIVIDGFLLPDVAAEVSTEFPWSNEGNWYHYDNPVEVKNTNQSWLSFPPKIYQLITHLVSPGFTTELSEVVGTKLTPDYGLHGGGLHQSHDGSRLGMHLDYYTHPKMLLTRKINLIVYLTPGWKPEWNGALHLAKTGPEPHLVGETVKKIDSLFNRAVIFDTTQNSWHGTPDVISCPPGIVRNSIAIYYLCQPKAGEDPTKQRKRALFSPSPGERGNDDLVKFCADRSKL